MDMIRMARLCIDREMSLWLSEPCTLCKNGAYYKNVSCEIIVPHLFSLSIMLWVGDEPLCNALLLPWWVFVRRMVDIKLVSQAPVADDMPKRWWGCCSGLQHKYRWKCWRNTPDTQYSATGFTQELRKLQTNNKKRWRNFRCPWSDRVQQKIACRTRVHAWRLHSMSLVIEHWIHVYREFKIE